MPAYSITYIIDTKQGEKYWKKEEGIANTIAKGNNQIILIHNKKSANVFNFGTPAFSEGRDHIVIPGTAERKFANLAELNPEQVVCKYIVFMDGLDDCYNKLRDLETFNGEIRSKINSIIDRTVVDGKVVSGPKQGEEPLEGGYIDNCIKKFNANFLGSFKYEKMIMYVYYNRDNA